MASPDLTTSRLELGGFSVLVREAGRGAGPPLLCLHGGPGLDGSYFFPDPERFGAGLGGLARDHHLIAYDQRGCGGSGVPEMDEPLALSRHVDDIEAVRSALGLERPAILAHSFGTVLGLLYSLYHPQGLSKLVLVGGAPTREFQDGYRKAVRELPEAVQRRLAELQSEDLDDAAFRERFRLALPLYFHRPLEPADRDAFVDSIAFSSRVNRAIAVGLADYDLRPALPNVRAQALLVYGESDRVVQPEYQLQFRGHLRTGRFVAFQESGHFPFLEEPDAFASVVRYFLSREDGSRALGSDTG
ncbi:MAG: alpha/beta fold hydrolase [Gemmatimonadota bacterium]